MRYYSTNGKSEKDSFKDVLFQGLAGDKGLFMPSSLPTLTHQQIFDFREKDYAEIAFEVLSALLGDEIGENDLRFICEDAYDFEVPLEQVYGRNFLLRLDRGPTASFKDFAARAMARMMQHFLKWTNESLTILTATSGDTGGAVANAFLGLENIRVIVLFPEKEVTGVQRKQMTTLGGNVNAVAVRGKFDDCQQIVKDAFVDPGLAYLNLTSANSINLGRLFPQSVYYFYAYSRTAKEKGEEVIFSVPSGNFGNLCGGTIAKKMGLPVKKFIAAVNENDEFPKFLETGSYEKVSPSKECISNAMNVGHPSNLARLIEFYGGNMSDKGEMRKAPDLGLMRKEIYSQSVSDGETRDTIKVANTKHGVLLEPHGAVGWKALEDYLKKTGKEESETAAISFETAHPAKFPEEIRSLLSIDPGLPDSLREVVSKEEDFETIEPDKESFKELLKQSKYHKFYV